MQKLKRNIHPLVWKFPDRALPNTIINTDLHFLSKFHTFARSAFDSEPFFGSGRKRF
jgi:hypothetical protein